MDSIAISQFSSLEEDHLTTYIFSPEDGPGQTARPPKRRKVPKKDAISSGHPGLETKALSTFVPLFGGAEIEACVAARENLYQAAWPCIDTRIQSVLRDVNRNTLEDVSAFLRDAPDDRDKVTAAFIVTGPNVASQELLFEQLAEKLDDLSPAKVIRLRSAEAPNLKTALKKIIRDALSHSTQEQSLEVAVGKEGRKYLDYDLEALHAYLKLFGSRRVTVVFQDTEAFDGGLLSDLIVLFRSWSSRIQFSLVFGIATSVELLQARILKSVALQIHGRQFDVIQSDFVLESVFKAAVASGDVALLLGPKLLQNLVDRQEKQVAGIQVFVSSLKYAYMCQFYANPLSVLLYSDDDFLQTKLQPDHLEAVRTLGSFKDHVESAVNHGQLTYALALLESDESLLSLILQQRRKWREYVTRLLRAIHLLKATSISMDNFIGLYIRALANGIDLSAGDSPLADTIRRLQPEQAASLAQRLLDAVKDGNDELNLPGWHAEVEQFVTGLSATVTKIRSLIDVARNTHGRTVRSKYSAQSKVLRTTVVAQKVQLSHDSAELTDEDNQFTETMDRLVELVATATSCDSIDSLLFREVWVYDSKSPYQDVFIPRLGAVIERALSRPHDYLSCTCCGGVAEDGGMAKTLPATVILYRLYREAGALVNVADLWSAFYNCVTGDSDDGDPADERIVLVGFYQALAELRSMGYLRQSRKKMDHVAKSKWL
ncbi:hypothetical protein VTK73DRAFT_1235 [Phialemonium thermophilum]|uniref:Origin recognition complex subunit n=1 Tax=Phialemonium thermophilum TaxID=223376 RepID=A0ABR3Y346_9PEZI